MDTTHASNLTATRERGESDMSDISEISATQKPQGDGTEVLKVSAHSRPSAVAGPSRLLSGTMAGPTCKP